MTFHVQKVVDSEDREDYVTVAEAIIPGRVISFINGCTSRIVAFPPSLTKSNEVDYAWSTLEKGLKISRTSCH